MPDGRAARQMEERPDALLKSALEKIVYFEARAEQLSNDLDASRAEAQRAKHDLATAAQREIDLRKQVAGLEVKEARAHQEREALSRMNEALRSERAALIGKLLEASRIHDADKPVVEDDGGFDLASFIAELRSEALAGRAAAASPFTPSVEPQARSRGAPDPAPAPVEQFAVVAAHGSLVTQHAERLAVEGRLAVSHRQMRELSSEGQPFPGRSEETLFGFSVRELSAPDAPSRQRAAERLKALGHPAAAPALASALNVESEPQVLVALLSAFASFARAEGVPIVTPLLSSAVPDVRIAALKTLLTLDSAQAGPHLAAATKDPDRAVRRRASLLALGLSGEAAMALGEQAIRDEDCEVRALAALVLGASGGDSARLLVQGALRDPEPKVRQAAAQALSRILGQDVSQVVGMDDAQRRREVRKLAALPSRPVTRARVLPAPAAAPARVSCAPAVPPPPARVVSEELCSALVIEVRSAIRGRSLADLSGATTREAVAVEEALGLLAARGEVVRRGAKYFAA
ncbi:MAG: HEAT repeat domain-containing protein [Myxococcaceae bacterium]